MRTTARKPTVDELVEGRNRKPVYKVVSVKDSKLRSLWVCGTKKWPQLIDVKLGITGLALTYSREGLSEGGKYGVWCCKTVREAKLQVKSNGRGKLCKIFLAHPLGKEIPTPRGWEMYGAVLYPAVILGMLPLATIDNRWR